MDEAESNGGPDPRIGQAVPTYKKATMANVNSNNNPRKRSRKAPQPPAVSWVDPKITQGGDPLASQPPAAAQAPEAQAAEAQAPEAQAAEAQAAAFDLESFLAGADTVISRIEANRKAGERLTRAAAAARQRVTWPQQVEQAAAAAGIRLPGLYPKPGSRSARGANGNGWYRDLPKSGKPGEPARGDLARELLWGLAGQQLATAGTLPTAQLLAAAAVIRRTFAKDRAQAPEWIQHLISPADKRPDGSVVGLQTCLMHQITLMAGSATILTPERIHKV